MDSNHADGLPREGDVAERITVGGHSFTIRYGYYTELDRTSGALMPILPDLERSPRFTAEGCPLVTSIQDACRHYRPRDGTGGDGWCADCAHYPPGHVEIGVCQCGERKRNPAAEAPNQPHPTQPNNNSGTSN